MKRKEDRENNEKKYSEYGSLFYPILKPISLFSRDIQTVFDGGFISRGWKKFSPNCEID